MNFLELHPFLRDKMKNFEFSNGMKIFERLPKIKMYMKNSNHEIRGFINVVITLVTHQLSAIGTAWRSVSTSLDCA